MSRMVSGRWIAQVAAVVLGLLLLAMGALGVVLDRLTHYPGNGGPLVDSLATAAAAVPAASVATLLAARRPRNPIGWLLFAILFVGANPSGQYDVWAYRMHPGTVPFGWVAVIVQELWPLFLVLITILLWVFPDGRLPGGRWRRPSAVLIVVGLLLGGAESLSGVVRVARHDVRITATGDLVGSSGTVFVFFAFTVVTLSLAAWLAWLAVQVPTYRRADGRAPPAAQVAVQRGGRHADHVHLGRVRDPDRAGPELRKPGQSDDQRAVHPVVRRAAGVHGRSGAEIPAVRAGPDRQPGGVLRAGHRAAGGRVRRSGAFGHPRAAAQVRGRGGGLHADHRGLVQPGAAAGAAGGGPALQPVPLRRRGAGGRVHRAAAAHRSYWAASADYIARHQASWRRALG